MLQIKPVFRCDEYFKDRFSASTCLLPVSLGQEAHEGTKFEATLHKISETFESCVILLGDTLQRHTLAMDFLVGSGDDFRELAFQRGDDWLCRNKPAFSKLEIPYTILRWDKWLQHPGFFALQQELLGLYETDVEYKFAFEETCSEFLMRYYARHSVDNDLLKVRLKTLCLNYLFEECTAMCLWPELSCEFEVYPSYRNSAMEETYRRFILPRYPEFLHAVRIKFKNKSKLMS